MPLLYVTELTKHYGDAPNLVRALDGVDLAVEPGEFVAIVGQSGSGKSTLLHMLGALDKPTSGLVVIDGQDLSCMAEQHLAEFRRRKIGFVFQSFNLIPCLNVYENIVLPIQLDGKKVDSEYVLSVIRALGLAEKLGAMPSQLSGGQQQRVAIARALATKPAIILADEPTGNLDSATSGEVLHLLKNTTNHYGQTLVMITHNERHAKMADRVVQIADGKIISNLSGNGDK